MTDTQLFEFACAGNGAFFGDDLGLKICTNCEDAEKHARANEEDRDFTCTCPWMNKECTEANILDIL